MVNKVILLGNLGKDPLIRRTESGVPVATFSLATSETYKDAAGQKQEKTEWHNIVMWRGLAEVAEKYLKKGSQIYVEGKLTTRQYEQDGVTKWITEVVAHNMVMLSKQQGSTRPLPTEPGVMQPGQAVIAGDSGVSSLTPEQEQQFEQRSREVLNSLVPQDDIQTGTGNTQHPANNSTQLDGAGEGTATAVSTQTGGDQGAGNEDDTLPF